MHLDNQLTGLVGSGAALCKSGFPLLVLQLESLHLISETCGSQILNTVDQYTREGETFFSWSMQALSKTGFLGSRILRDYVVSIAQLLLMGTVEKRGLLPRAEGCLCWLSPASNHMLMLHKQIAVLFGLSSYWTQACALKLELQWSWVRHELMTVSCSC